MTNAAFISAIAALVVAVGNVIALFVHSKNHP